MNDSAQEEFLSVPTTQRQVFETNFLDCVVVECRFPTILELRSAEPTELCAALSKRFPLYSQSNKVEMRPFEQGSSEKRYEFQTRSKAYSVSVTSENLVLRANEYRSFEEFSDLLGFLVETCKQYLDMPFFTRIGYRWINILPDIPNNRDELSLWINGNLVAALQRPELGHVHEAKSEIVGSLSHEVGYRLMHGLALEKPRCNYILDFDYWRDDCEVDDLKPFTETVHDRHFSFFWWCLGDQSREQLSTQG
jgi:uncharacterized protein (TIGR04255 family)